MTSTLTGPAAPAAVAVAVAEPPPSPSDATDWRRPAPLVLGAVAFLLCVAWTNRVFLWAGTLRAALLLAVLGPGLIALAVLVARRDRAAYAGTAFLLVAVASTAVARVPLMALFGEYFSPIGLLFTVACLGLWALGRSAVPRAAAPVVAAAVLAGATVNAAVAWLQMSTDLGIRGLGPVDGRASGLLGNPVFLSALCAGAVWLALAWVRRSPRPLVPLLVLAFLVGAVQLSGDGPGLLAVLVGCAWFVVGDVRRRDWTRLTGVLVALALGILLSLAPAGSAGSAADERTVTAPAVSRRVSVWEAGVRSLSDDPLLGVGPGRFGEASSPRRGLVSVRYEGRDILLGDAHDVVVEVLTTTGVLGLLAFGAWLVLSGRRARGALAGFAALVGITMLLEPLDLAVTPLVCLALGAATVAGAVPRPSFRAPRWTLVVGAVLAVAGLVLGVRLVVGDAAYADAVAHHSMADLRTAERLSPPWPQYPGLRAALIEDRADARHDARLGREAIAAQRAAIARDPADPKWWWGLGQLEEQWGTVGRARADYHAALRRNPWSYSTLIHLYGLELRTGHLGAARAARARLCEIGPTECPPTPEVIARMRDTPPPPADDRTASTR